MHFEPTVYIVDDDPGILKSMRWLLESAHLRVQTFNSGASFLECYDAGDPGCLILDMRMPGMTGLEVQKRLAQMGAQLPIIIMTAHADVRVCIESFKSGVFDFIEKPADDDCCWSASEKRSHWMRRTAGGKLPVTILRNARRALALASGRSCIW